MSKFIRACERMRAWREASSLTQTEVANRLGITKAMVCEYECGHKLPRSNIQARIQVLTGIPMIDWHPEAAHDVRISIEETIDEERR